MTWNSQDNYKFIALLVLFLIYISDAFADEIKLRSENFTHLTIEDGLPQNNVRCIEEDQYGFLWLCTSDGLVRYDGYEFELITEGADGSRISNTRLRAILADGNNLWIATEKGLNRFDLEEGIFEYISLDINGVTNSNHISSLLKVKEGELWVGTINGIIILKYIDGVKLLSKLNYNINARYMLNSMDKVFVADYGNGVVEIDLKTNKVDKSIVFPEELANNIINISLYDNKLFFSTYGNGLLIFDTNLQFIKQINTCNKHGSECLSSDFVFFAKEYNNKIWVGTQNGFNILDKITLDVENKIQLTSLINNKYISDSIIAAHFSEKNLWFGLRPGGLVKYRLELGGVNYYQTKHSAEVNYISDRSVYAVANNNTDIFVGTYSGLYKLEHNNNTLEPIPFVNSKLKESSQRISFMCFSDDNNLYMATGGGLYHYNMVMNTLERKYPLDENIDSVRYINCTENRILVGTISGKIYQYHRDDDTFNLLNNANEISTINSIFDAENLYIATYSGLKIYSLDKGSLTEIQTLLDGHFITKAVSTASYILIGTHGEGLFAWDKSLQKLIKVPLAYQTIGNSIYDIVIINDQAWVSTNNGIIQLNLDTFDYFHYVQSHGLGDKEYSMGALLFQDNIQTLYAGGLTGLTSIDINSFANVSRKPENIFSKISVIDNNGVILRNYFNNPSSIIIDEGNSLLIQLGKEYSSIRFKSGFNYIVDRLTTSTVSMLRPNQRQISLVDISNNNFQISIGKEQYNSLYIKVNPYLWKRWWAIVLYLLFSYLIAKRLYLYLKSIQDTKNREILSNKELNLKRKQLASLSHELRTPLNAIIGITDSASNNETEIQYIKSSAYLLRSLIDNALDSISLEVSDTIIINKEALNISSVIKEAINILNVYISASNIQLLIQVDDNVPQIIISDKLRIQQIIINLVKNAIKHSITATTIIIKISVFDNFLMISVSDNGVGINYDDQPLLFDVFYKVDKKKSGFGLGLYISKLICQALGGDLVLDSEPDKGSSFTLRIPFEVSTQIDLSDKVISHNRIQKIKQLLILEDDPLNIFAMRAQLNKLGYESYKIVNSYADYCSENKKEYDCIILDLNFGHDLYNGIDLAKILKSDNYSGKVYILTAESDALIKADALNYVHDYIIKPISPLDIEEMLFSIK